jgi:serine/threonine protein kinase
MTHPSGLLIGRYQLLERIAAGGMGEVYVALQTGIGRFSRPIAVKLLLPHLADDPRSVSMFLNEARVGAQMTHANIAQVYDVGLDHDRYFIAMELVRGVALQKLIAGLKGADEHVSAELLAYIGRSLSEGLHVAHEQPGPDGQPMELVHRDVTPHNVLLGVDGAVKLTDFGIARVADADRLSRPGIVLGKLGYLAPEQILGSPVDRRVDIFAAGATLYHLAALEKPFDTPTGATLDPARVPTLSLRVYRPDLPGTLVDAIERCLCIDPNARFSTARELRNALPVPGPEAAEELGRLVRRVCAAALMELEQKTERATQALEGDAPPSTSPQGPTRVDGIPSAPDAVASSPTSASQTNPAAWPLRDRRPWVVLGAICLVLAATLGIWLLAAGERERAPSQGTPIVDHSPVAHPVAHPVALLVDAGAPQALDAPPLAVTAPKYLAAGTLTVDATPWALLTLDGRRFGETPRAEVHVPPGVHLLVATCPDTGKTARRTVTIVSGRAHEERFDLR